MFEGSQDDESQDIEPEEGEESLDDDAELTEKIVEAVGAWPVPEGAVRARRIQENLIAAVRSAFPDPQMVAYLAVGPLMVAMGRIEVELLDARRRIVELERAVAERDR